MSIRALNRDSIESVNTISCSEVSKIQSVINEFAREGIYSDDAYALPAESARSPGFSDIEIVNLSARLDRLKQRVDNYNPSLIYKIIHFIIGRLCKVWRLRRSLPDIIEAVHKIAQKTLIPPPPAPPIHGGGRGSVPIHIIPPAQPAPGNTIADKKILIKGCLEAVSQAIELEEKEGSSRPLSANALQRVECARKAQRVFQKIFERLDKGRDWAIPQFYHATGKYDGTTLTAATSILTDRQIKAPVIVAPKGHGVFFSTNDEGNGCGGGYGNVTFAFDPNALANAYAHYFYGLIQPAGAPAVRNHLPSVWVCLKKEHVDVVAGNLAMVITTADKIADVAALLRSKGYNPRTFDATDTKELADNDMPLLTSEEATTMRLLIDSRDRYVPDTWYFDRREIGGAWTVGGWWGNSTNELAQWDAIQAKLDSTPPQPLTADEIKLQQELKVKLQNARLPQNMRHRDFNLRVTPATWPNDGPMPVPPARNF